MLAQRMLSNSGDQRQTWRYALLRYATLLYAFGLIVHTADHLHRGIDVLTWEVLWAGNVSTILGVVVIVLVLAGHRLAPLLAAVTGISIAVGVSAVHLLPHWSAFSDAFPGASGTGVTPVSWTVVLVEIVGALAMGIAGASLLRTNGDEPSTRGASPSAA